MAQQQSGGFVEELGGYFSQDAGLGYALMQTTLHNPTFSSQFRQAMDSLPPEVKLGLVHAAASPQDHWKLRGTILNVLDNREEGDRFLQNPDGYARRALASYAPEADTPAPPTAETAAAPPSRTSAYAAFQEFLDASEIKLKGALKSAFTKADSPPSPAPSPAPATVEAAPALRETFNPQAVASATPATPVLTGFYGAWGRTAETASTTQYKQPTVSVVQMLADRGP